MAIFRQLSLGMKAALAAGTIFVSMIVSRSFLAESLELGAWRWLFRLQMALFTNSLMLIGSLYIWRGTVGNLSHGPAAESACFQLWKMAVVAFLAMAHSSFFTTLFLVAEEPYLFSLVAYSCLGAYVIMVFFLCLLSGMEQAFQLLAWRNAKAVDSLNKSRKLALRPALAVAVTAVLSVAGLLNAAQPPAVKTVAVPIHQLPPSIDHLKIVLLSDIHLGPTVGRTKMEMFVRMVNRLEPDVTVIVGDLCDSEASILRTAVTPLSQLRSRLGTYSGHGMDLEKALAGCNTDHTTVLLAHQPLAAKRALQARPDINLILSGHTHAGQIFPLNVAAYLLNPFFAGLYQVAQTTFVYVSPGTAYYGIPMRLGSRAEITELILQRAP